MLAGSPGSLWEARSSKQTFASRLNSPSLKHLIVYLLFIFIFFCSDTGDFHKESSAKLLFSALHSPAEPSKTARWPAHLASCGLSYEKWKKYDFSFLEIKLQ